jgi:GT2 family glycosyltransferase
LKSGYEDVKIILGAHSEVDENFIIENIKILNENDEIMCSGGVLENVYENKAANIVGIAMSSPFGVGNAHFRTGAKDGIVDTVAFGAYKKSVFTTIGYFDEDLARNQDDEFNYRLLQSGGKIYLSKKIKCKYFVRSSYLKLFNQYYQYGFWKVFVGKKHGAITTVRQLIPMLFVVFNILIILTLLISSKLAITMLLGDVVYLLGAFYFALKTKEVLLLPQIIYTFLILHISYGFGYLMGVFNFLLLSRSPDQKTKLTR